MSHYLHIKLAFTAVAICFVIVGRAAAQSAEAQPPIIVNGSNNETTKAQLDLLAQSAGNDKLIILIARLGKGESSVRLNRRRLQTASNYLKTVRAIPEQRIITAESKPVRGLGRVEAYLCDKLLMIFTLERNRNFAEEQ